MDRMQHISPLPPATRRRFVQGAAAAVLAAVGGRHLRRAAAATSPAVLSGTDFNLEVGTLGVNFTGTPRVATVVNGQVPAPVLRWREGDLITVRVANRLDVPTSIHWHGVLVPADMDGVPGVSFSGIAPGQSFIYRFRVKQSGTYWYHSHSRFQQQTGLYGPIIIEPRSGTSYAAERDYTVLLSDWTDLDPEHVYRLLKIHSEYFNFNRRTLGDFFADVREEGLRQAMDDRRMWGRMRMDPTDLADVTGYVYTYLMNGTTPAGNWTGLFQRGERLRLRFINGSAMSIFDVRIPGLSLRVVAADGQDVDTVSVDEFRLGTGEVLDCIVEPKADNAYTILAQSIDRSGYARGTLAPQPGMQAEVPALDPRPLLQVTDMDTTGNMGAMATGMSGMQSGSRLDDPGVGLRGNGRRVLTYADLHTRGGSIDSRQAQREVELHLTGDMQRFIWSFDGRKFSQAEPLPLNYGERLRIALVNDTMMNHPIHLHGMWSELQSERGEFLVRKHTVTVQPGQRLAYGVTAAAPGRWAYHCHLLYHMEAGMFRVVTVGQPGDEAQHP